MIASLSYLLHPLVGNGYQFWSGIGSDFSELAIGCAVVAFFRQHNCHVRGCKRLGSRDDAVGAHACRRHHTLRHKHGVDPHSPIQGGSNAC
jgi:hypothetical protein